MSNAIQLYARETPGFAERVAHTSALLQSAARDHAGHIVLASSLGAEDMVLTDLIVRAELPIAVATLETGKLHAQTLALVQRTERHYGLRIELHRPVHEAVVHFVRQHGDDAMYRSIELRKACCAMRKLEPLQRLLADRSAWVTGLRREQSDARGSVPFSEVDEHGRIKLSPLADWSWSDVWHYIATRHVPYNPLHDEFMPSIGCEPCTRAIAVGEDFRSGRWWWEDETAKECGLHVSGTHAEDTGVSMLPRRKTNAEGASA
jgi:phosphoadenosine phosphosulfate reductase